jgi:hemoglobin-like flavoprotein/class 3 adenylate cyclase
VLILDGEGHLSGRTEAEAKIAGEQGFASNIRLACQARVNGDVTLRRVLEEAEGTHELAESSQALPAQQREVVALYCGLRGARAFVAGGYPHDVVHVVNRCLRQITEPILANRGAVERYMGERILALFGADGADPRESAVNALRASLRAAARFRHLNQTLVRRFNHTLEIGVGLHADSVVMGQAFPAMTHLGALGDVDEVATRIERAAHAAGVLIGASPSFLRLVGQDVTTGKAFAVEARPGEAPMEGVEIVNFVKPDAVLIVQSTFERVAPSADAFARMFYDRLFDESADVAALFEHVDMPVQRKMLMDVLAVAVRGLDRIESVVPILQELGRRHAGYGARTAHYKLVGEALVWSLRSFFKDDFTPEVELAWIEIYGIIAKTMIDATKSPDGRAVA